RSFGAKAVVQPKHSPAWQSCMAICTLHPLRQPSNPHYGYHSISSSLPAKFLGLDLLRHRCNSQRHTQTQNGLITKLTFPHASFRHVCVPSEVESPKPIQTLPDSHSRRTPNFQIAFLGIGDEKWSPYRHILLIQRLIYRKSLGKLTRAVRQLRIGDVRSETPHCVNPFYWLKRPEQDCSRSSRLLRCNVQTIMMPVGEVNVSVPRVTKHCSIPWSQTPKRVTCRIIASPISLDFHDTTNQAFTVLQSNQTFPEKIRSNLHCVPLKEG